MYLPSLISWDGGAMIRPGSALYLSHRNFMMTRSGCISLPPLNRVIFSTSINNIRRHSVLLPVQLSKVERSFPYLPFAEGVYEETSITTTNNIRPHTVLLPLQDELSTFAEEVEEETYTDHELQIARSEELYRQSCLASPIIQIFSIAIDIHTDDDFKDNNNEEPYEIFGSIQAIEQAQGSCFTLFNKPNPTSTSTDDDGPEIILNHGNLSLTSSATYIPCSVHASTSMEVCLSLRDHRTRDNSSVVLVQGKHVLHNHTQDFEKSYDKLFKACIKGDYASAIVYYTTFQFAVVAIVTVKVSLHDNNASCHPFLDIYGTIVADYPNADQYCSTEDDFKYMKKTLFHKSPNDCPVQATVSSPIRLSKFYIAVPAYSSLRFHANLWTTSHGLFTHGSVEFPSNRTGDFTQLIDGEDGFVSVNVRYINTCDKRHRCYAKRGVYKVSSDQEEEENSAYHPFGRVYTIEDGIGLAEGYGMAEVFSIHVTSFRHKVSTLCGHIKVDWQRSLYERDLCNPDMMSNENIVSIGCDYVLDSDNFSMDIWLKDPTHNLDLGRGLLCESDRFLENSSLYDKRLCEIIRGKDGYAAVHYIVFSEACHAFVEIKFLSDNVDPTMDIYGCVFARYSTHEYSTRYERTYYRSRLFDKPLEEQSVQLGMYENLPLLKSAVAVPTDASLIIEADLRAKNSKDTAAAEEAICGMISFDVDPSGTFKKTIRALHCSIQVSVKFVEYNLCVFSLG